MKPQIKSFLALSSVFLALQSMAQDNHIGQQIVVDLAQKYNVNAEVLSDFVESYNFKCPKELHASELVRILNDENEDSELSVMIESNRLQWRDIYLEARSGISCIHEGIVSSPY